MGQSELSKSEEIQNRPEETQDDKPTEQSPDQDSVEEKFYDLDITEINRDDLTPEMQSAYDRLLEQHANMQTDYTRKTQNISALSRDAGAWRSITQHPGLSKLVYDGIYKVENNIPLDGQAQRQTQEAPKLPDPQDDPEAYIRNIVRNEVSDVISPLVDQMKQVTGFVHGNQANLEFENLSSKYPAAKGIGMQEIKRVQGQYTGPNGQRISMEEALTLIARDNPSILSTQQSPPLTRQRKTPVEKPTQTRGGKEEIPLPPGVRNLMQRARDLEKEGDVSLAGRAKAALGKLRAINPEE